MKNDAQTNIVVTRQRKTGTTNILLQMLQIAQHLNQIMEPLSHCAWPAFWTTTLIITFWFLVEKMRIFLYVSASSYLVQLTFYFLTSFISKHGGFCNNLIIK